MRKIYLFLKANSNNNKNNNNTNNKIVKQNKNR